jgi:hypothetical protein
VPFLFGGILALLLAGGGAGAAWYLNLLPASPSAQPRPAAKLTGPVSAAPSKADMALEMIAEGKHQDALQHLEKATPKSPEAMLKSLIEFKEQAPKIPVKDNKSDLALQEALAKFQQLQKQQQDLETAKAQSDKSLKDINDALAKAGVKDANDLDNLVAGAKGGAAAMKKDLDDLMKARDAAVKGREAVESELKSLDAAVEAALAELKEGNFLGNDPDKLKQLVEGTKKARQSGQSPLASTLGSLIGAFGGISKTPADVFSQALSSAKLSAAAAAAKTQDAFAESPEKRLDTMIALLGGRGVGEAKELEAFKRYIDGVRSKDSKVNPELRVKALYADALLQRSQQNIPAARQSLEQAIVEARAIKGGEALQTAATQALKELNQTTVRTADTTFQPNPLLADKHFSTGLDLFWNKNYTAAEVEFTKALTFYDEDARYCYFLGMARYLQGSTQKRKLAETDFERGVQLELARHPGAREINSSLERVQGDMRRLVNSYREKLQ